MDLRNQFAHGFSLIELSVATAVFSMGLAGVSMMLLSAISGTAESGHETLATYSASSLAEQISVNMDVAGHFVNPVVSTPSCILENACDEAETATNEFIAWQQVLVNELPNGQGLVCRDSSPEDGDLNDPKCDDSGGLVVKVFWQEISRGDSLNVQSRRFISRIPD